MKNNLKNTFRLMLALPVFLLLDQIAFAQEKVKKSGKLEDSQQIIIKWKGEGPDSSNEKGSKVQKDTKLIIELNDEEVLVNGKPLDDFNDDELAVLKKDIRIMDGNSFEFAFPPAPASPFQGEGRRSPERYQFFRSQPGEPRAFLGIMSEKTNGGVIITEVTAETAAEKAGLKEGDIITRIDTAIIRNPQELSKYIGRQKPGSKVTVYYIRTGKDQKASIALGSRKTPEAFSIPWNDMNEDIAREFRVLRSPGQPKIGIKAQDTEDGKGVKILEIDEASAAEKAGLKAGDIIRSMDGAEVNDVNQLLAISRAARDAKKPSMVVKFLRDNKLQQAALRIPRKLRTAEL